MKFKEIKSKKNYWITNWLMQPKLKLIQVLFKSCEAFTMVSKNFDCIFLKVILFLLSLNGTY